MESIINQIFSFLIKKKPYNLEDWGDGLFVKELFYNHEGLNLIPNMHIKPWVQYHKPITPALGRWWQQDSGDLLVIETSSYSEFNLKKIRLTRTHEGDLESHIHVYHEQPIPPHAQKGEKESYTLFGEIVSSFNTWPKMLRINHKKERIWTVCGWFIGKIPVLQFAEGLVSTHKHMYTHKHTYSHKQRIIHSLWSLTRKFYKKSNVLFRSS